MVLHNMQVLPESGQRQHYNLFLGYPPRAVVGEILLWAELQAVHHEKWPDVWLYTNSRAVGNIVWWSGTWKEYNWKTGSKEAWESGMWTDFSVRVKNVKIFVSHANAYEKVTSAEEDLNNQVDRITHSVDISQTLFSYHEPSMGSRIK